eukprot:2310575-Rhodomonas_salina.1
MMRGEARKEVKDGSFMRCVLSLHRRRTFMSNALMCLGNSGLLEMCLLDALLERVLHSWLLLPRSAPSDPGIARPMRTDKLTGFASMLSTSAFLTKDVACLLPARSATEVGNTCSRTSVSLGHRIANAEEDTSGSTLSLSFWRWRSYSSA